MKYILLVLLVSICCFQVKAQQHSGNTTEKIEPDEVVFSITEQQPEYPGGFVAMVKFLNATIKYPAGDTLGNSETKVYVRFVVSKTGKIGQITFLKPTQQVFQDEVIRVFRLMPDWIPGRNNGQVVNCYFTVPFVVKK